MRVFHTGTNCSVMVLREWAIQWFLAEAGEMAAVLTGSKSGRDKAGEGLSQS